MSKNKALDNELEETIYLSGKFYFLKILFLAFIFLLVGFIVNYPIKEGIKQQISAALSSRSCSIQYDEIKVNTFPPAVKILKPIIPNRCQGMRNQKIPLKNISLEFTRPSISPPGIRFHAQIQEGKTRINAFPAISLTKHIIKVQNSKIDSSFINKFIGQGNILAGALDLKSLITLKSSLSKPNQIKVSQADILITSNDFATNSYSLMGGFFKLPRLDIGKLKLKASMTKAGQLLVREFSLGSSNSPIVAKFTGKIIVNQSNFQQSDLDISGEIKFSRQFTEQIPINLLVGNKKPDKSGFYKLKLSGKLSRPKHQFL